MKNLTSENSVFVELVLISWFPWTGKTIHEGQLQTRDPIFQESEFPDQIAEVETVMITVINLHSLHHHGVGGQDIGIVIVKDIARQGMVVAVGVTAAVIALDVVANHTTAAKAERSSWKVYRWIWWKKTLGSSFPSLLHLYPIVLVAERNIHATFPATSLEGEKLRCACHRRGPVDMLDRFRMSS
jgi:hypothetical protein